MIRRRLSNLCRADRHRDAVGINDDGLSVEPASNLTDIRIRGEHDVGPSCKWPLRAEEGHPSSPEFLIVPVVPELMTNLTDVHGRMQFGEPAGAKFTRGSISRCRAVHEHHQLLTTLCRPIDHERVAQVGRVKSAHDQARCMTARIRRRHRVRITHRQPFSQLTG